MLSEYGWMKESLEEIKIANANARIYGNADENEVVKVVWPTLTRNRKWR